MTEDPSRDTAAAVRFVVAADLSEVSGVRRVLVEAVRSAGDDATIAQDIALVASELSTNVIQYVDTDEFVVSCVRDGSAWVLEVSHADGVDLTAPETAEPRATGGRGLVIVRALMDQVELVDREDGVAIRCVKSVV